MKKRCNGTNGAYHKTRYSDRGITYDPSWESYDGFLADMGERPDGKTIDRINNDKGYYKENCRWATKEEQDNNKSTSVLLTLNGETRTQAQWSAIKGLPGSTLCMRLKSGWSVERALTTPRINQRKDKQSRGSIQRQGDPGWRRTLHPPEDTTDGVQHGERPRCLPAHHHQVRDALS